MDKKETKEQKTVGKPYTLRKLTDRDLWPVLDIIGKVLPDDLSSLFSQVMLKEKSLEEVGAEGVTKIGVAIIRNMDKAQDDIYAFLADVSGISAQEIQAMPFGTTPRMIWEIVQDVKNAGFFGAAS